MAGKNLVEELGHEYVTSYFQGAMLQSEGNLYRFVHMRSSAMALVQKFLPDGSPINGWEEVHIPASALKGFTSFSSPKLGYRNIKRGPDPHSVTYLTSQRSTRRGFRLDNIRADNLSVFNLENVEAGWDFLDLWTKTKVVYSPEFVGLKQGLAELQAGNLLGFAVNHDIAIAIDMDIAAKFPWSIYFKGMRVGGISDTGIITIHNKIVNRQEVRSQLEILE